MITQAVALSSPVFAVHTIIATATTAPEQVGEEEVEFHLLDRVNGRQ